MGNYTPNPFMTQPAHLPPQLRPKPKINTKRVLLLFYVRV